MKEQEQIANLVREVAMSMGYERAAICAVDCLLQWKLGLLNETIEAWSRFLKEIANQEPHTDTQRHGAWVPAIPM